MSAAAVAIGLAVARLIMLEGDTAPPYDARVGGGDPRTSKWEFPVDDDSGAATTTGGVDHSTTGDPMPHEIGKALHEHSKSLAIYPAHPLDKDRYTAGAADATDARGGVDTAGATDATDAVGGAKRKKAWDTYPTWEALQQDKNAMNDYLAVRSKAIEEPNFDWGPVLMVMQPRLVENREYIGVASVGSDGRTLHVVASAASPTTTDHGTNLTFASIPGALVAEYASKPGLFLFHTHPSSFSCCQLPSSHDLAAAIHSGVATQFAGHAVISRYGVFTYGLDWDVYKAIQTAEDPHLAKLHYVHDVVAAHESIRSWSMWTIPEYLKFYARYRMYVNSYPSGYLVGDSRSQHLADLELPVDHEIITDYMNDIVLHKKPGVRRGQK